MARNVFVAGWVRMRKNFKEIHFHLLELSSSSLSSSAPSPHSNDSPSFGSQDVLKMGNFPFSLIELFRFGENKFIFRCAKFHAIPRHPIHRYRTTSYSYFKTRRMEIYEKRFVICLFVQFSTCNVSSLVGRARHCHCC